LETIEKEEKPDLDLKALDCFNGTSGYVKYLGSYLTDGVVYIMKNGYSWFVSDSLLEIKSNPRLRSEGFITIKLIVNREKSTATVQFEDGNNKILKRKYYDYTDAKRDLKLFFIDNVLMLASEY